MNSDFRELSHELKEHDVRYLIIGGYAVIHYTEPRFTKDLDIWLDATPENAGRTAKALTAFGPPLVEVTEAGLATPGTQFMVGIPPAAIDLLTSCAGLIFADCWLRREMVSDHELQIPFVGKSDLIVAKQTAGRPEVQIDLRKLRKTSPQ
ncbi:MAG: hypothetical protein ACR2OZ_06655 [Verrucomicrobiales bacterium]